MGKRIEDRAAILWQEKSEAVKTLFASVKEAPNQTVTIFDNLDPDTSINIKERLNTDKDAAISTVEELRTLRETYQMIPGSYRKADLARLDFLLSIWETSPESLEDLIRIIA